MNYYLKATNRLYKSELRQIVHNNSAKNILSSCRGDILPAGMSVQAALDALRRGDLVLLRYEHLGAPLNGIFDIGQEFASDLPETYRQAFQNTGDAMSDISQAEHDQKEAKREQQQLAENALTQCSFDSFYLKLKRADKAFSLHVDEAGNDKYLGKLGCAVQVIGTQKVNYNFNASCGGGKESCPAIKIFHVDRKNTSSRGSNVGTFLETSLKGGAYKVSPAKSDRITLDLLKFLKEKMFPKISDFNVASYCFTNEKNTCDSNIAYSGYVDVFPKYKWEGSVFVGLDVNIGGGDKGKIEWEIKPGAKFKYINGPITVEPPKLSYKDDRLDINLDPSKFPLDKLFGKLGKGLSEFKSKVDGFKDEKFKGVKNKYGKDIVKNPKSPVTCKIEVLKLTVSGGYELVEPKDDRMVCCERKIMLDFKPLISATVELDILAAIVMRYCGKGVGGILLDALKELSEEGIGAGGTQVKAGLSCVLTVKGSIGGKVGWKTTQKNAAGEVVEVDDPRNEVKDEKSTEWQIDAGLEISLKADSFLEVASAGVTMRSTMSAAIAGTKKKDAEAKSVSNSVGGKLEAGDEKKLGKWTAEGAFAVPEKELDEKAKAAEEKKKEEAKAAAAKYEPVSLTGSLSPGKNDNGDSYLKKDVRFSGISIVFSWVVTAGRTEKKSKDKTGIDNKEGNPALPKADGAKKPRRGTGGAKISYNKVVDTELVKGDISAKVGWKEGDASVDLQAILLKEWTWSNIPKKENDEKDKNAAAKEDCKEELGAAFA